MLIASTYFLLRSLNVFAVAAEAILMKKDEQWKRILRSACYSVKDLFSVEDYKKEQARYFVITLQKMDSSELHASIARYICT
mmetsp:Transcript_24697/g.62515  ORF Transcript_24697/g.62515 Transcript_24697/m.62515 type:complete len:82 (+) Transcript_24697:892-1137(+)